MEELSEMRGRLKHLREQLYTRLVNDLKVSMNSIPMTQRPVLTLFLLDPRELGEH